jgi:leucyl-tRNA synthetase
MSAAKASTEVVDPNTSTTGTLKIENVRKRQLSVISRLIRLQTDKRDTLQATEKKYQKQWEDSKVFEADAPSCSEYSIDTPDLHTKIPKFFGRSKSLGLQSLLLT